MKKIVLALTYIFIIGIGTYAKERHHKKRHHKAHEHGNGKLSLVTDGNQLVIELEVPAHDIVGFEHRPRTKDQKSKVKEAIEFLKVANSNLELPRNSDCNPMGPGKVEAELSVEKHEKEDHHEEGHHHEDGEHSEFHIIYKYTCSNMGNLNFIKVLSFNKFKNMKKLKAQGVTKIGQFSKTLTPKSSQFDLRR